MPAPPGVGTVSIVVAFSSLCTPGEKDVGFPYNESEPFRKTPPVSPALFGRFSWSAYPVARGAMADWVDRGRDHPLHRQWAASLRWVFEQAHQEVIVATVTHVARSGNGWRVHYREPGGQLRVRRVDGIVLTGTGSPNPVNIAEEVPNGKVFDSETVWANRSLLQKLEKGTIAVAGDGGGGGHDFRLACRAACRDIRRDRLHQPDGNFVSARGRVCRAPLVL